MAASSGVGSYKEEREQNNPTVLLQVYPHPPCGESLGLLRGVGGHRKVISREMAIGLDQNISSIVEVWIKWKQHIFTYMLKLP